MSTWHTQQLMWSELVFSKKQMHVVHLCLAAPTHTSLVSCSSSASCFIPICHVTNFTTTKALVVLPLVDHMSLALVGPMIRYYVCFGWFMYIIHTKYSVNGSKNITKSQNQWVSDALTPKPIPFPTNLPSLHSSTFSLYYIYPHSLPILPNANFVYPLLSIPTFLLLFETFSGGGQLRGGVIGYRLNAIIEEAII